jgi:hypothetical protein
MLASIERPLTAPPTLHKLRHAAAAEVRHV